MDGSGFPDSLQGDQIPMEARIVAVVDAFDAMTTNRAYRKSPHRRRSHPGAAPLRRRPLRPRRWSRRSSARTAMGSTLPLTA